MVEDTVFHRIIRGELPADVLYQDDEVMIIRDINPKAPTHLLIIAKKPEDHVETIAHVTERTAHVPGMLINKAKDFALDNGIEGYKLMFHVGREGGAVILDFLHLHLLSEQEIS